MNKHYTRPSEFKQYHPRLVCARKTMRLLAGYLASRRIVFTPLSLYHYAYREYKRDIDRHSFSPSALYEQARIICEDRKGS